MCVCGCVWVWVCGCVEICALHVTCASAYVYSAKMEDRHVMAKHGTSQRRQH